MFASNFNIKNEYLKHERGQENLTVYSQNKTIGSKLTMSDYFCKTCGSLMYRVGEDWPGWSCLRLGTVDDFTLMETMFKPKLEQYVEMRVSWLSGVEGARKAEGMGFNGASGNQNATGKL
jgi:hypothetical protein